MLDTIPVLIARIRGLGDSSEMCDCKLGRNIIMNERSKLQDNLRSRQAQQIQRNAGGYSVRNY